MEPQACHIIADVTLDQQSVMIRSEEAKHECRTAIADLLDDNRFYPCNGDGQAQFDGPYGLHLSIQDNRLMLHIVDAAKTAEAELAIPVSPFRSLIKDYFLICESYYKALQAGNNRKVEAIDMGRRGIHNEGSELLADMLSDKAFVDFETARRLFTLVCVLHLR